jgi:hypothetical protein
LGGPLPFFLFSHRPASTPASGFRFFLFLHPPFFAFVGQTPRAPTCRASHIKTQPRKEKGAASLLSLPDIALTRSFFFRLDFAARSAQAAAKGTKKAHM